MSAERSSIAVTCAEVLIVDDNEDLAENMVEILEGVESPLMRCRIAPDGRTALALARASAVDVVVLDMHLPDTKGTDLAGELRQTSPFVEVVVVTGDTAIENAIRAVQSGAFAYVLKPFRASQMVETVRRAVEKVHLRRERAHLRKELENSERRHREVVEAIPAFVLGLDSDGRIALWNKRLEEVTGYERREMLGEAGSHLVGDSGEDRRLGLKIGGHRMVRWQSAPLHAGEEAVTYALGIDVTDELEMHRRTMRAERLAAVGTLAAGLAHEVRNPLNSALLQINVLERRLHKGASPEQILAVTKIVKDEISRLDHLVRDFLAFAQPRPLTLRVVAVNDLLAGVVDLVSFEAEQRGIALECIPDPTAGSINAEPERMRQVLLNLLRNSLESMGAEGIVTLRSSGPDAAGNVHIEVHDTGPGFPEDAPVFDAFYTTKEQGTGLGLSIAHSIVTEHGGQIAVTSKPGATCFTLTLPQVP